jgi:hypothetical protein
MTSPIDYRALLCDEDDAVLGWRFEQLCVLGFADAEALLLARSELDLQLLRRLIGAGCPLGLAVEIAR